MSEIIYDDSRITIYRRAALIAGAELIRARGIK